MIAIMVVFSICGAIVLLAIRFVIGAFSKRAEAKFARGVDVVGSFFLKTIVVILGAAIVVAFGQAILSMPPSP